MEPSNSLLAIGVRPIAADDTIALRHSVLWPNKPVDHVRLPEDDAGFHYGAFLDGVDSPIAVISFFKNDLPEGSGANGFIPHPGEQIQFRKFACDPTYQGRGIGTTLLQYILERARKGHGASVVWCDARTSSEGWYKKRGFVGLGDVFFKSSVEYIRMAIET
ncbi:hypothetical protein BC834DRAFT_387389 [Gloeopeniophorella convolvens]|nr:hypothetical protein BC834DRAFT_387389 [Gloeopeniophorella convolvens]